MELKFVKNDPVVKLFTFQNLYFLVCVRGTDKPLDLALIIDSSESIEQVFKSQIHFAVERIVNRINVHPDAVR